MPGDGTGDGPSPAGAVVVTVALGADPQAIAVDEATGRAFVGAGAGATRSTRRAGARYPLRHP